MNKEELQLTLTEFLSKNVQLADFIRNSRHSNLKSFIEKEVGSEAPSAISCAFDWSKSPEGYQFWHKLSTEWRSNLQEEKKPKGFDYSTVEPVSRNGKQDCTECFFWKGHPNTSCKEVKNFHSIKGYCASEENDILFKHKEKQPKSKYLPPGGIVPGPQSVWDGPKSELKEEDIMRIRPHDYRRFYEGSWRNDGTKENPIVIHHGGRGGGKDMADAMNYAIQRGGGKTLKAVIAALGKVEIKYGEETLNPYEEPKQIECEACDGTGNGCENCEGDCRDGPNKICEYAGEDDIPCEACNGTGMVDAPKEKQETFTFKKGKDKKRIKLVLKEPEDYNFTGGN